MSQHLIATNPRERLIDREISWLAFNERVLELAEDESNPLLERCRYLAIFSSNLDDFFMIRVATLKRKLETGVTKKNTAGYSPIELMEEISKKTKELISRQSKCFHNDLLPKLKQNGIEITDWESLSEGETSYINSVFTKRIFPVLTPLAVDPSHPFPYISGLSLNIGINIESSDDFDISFARVKVPSNLPRFIRTSDTSKFRFVLIDELIAEHLSELFPGVTLKDHFFFRVTRNQDLDLDEDDSLVKNLALRKFEKPRIPFIGVLISWDIFARNDVLVSATCWASSLATSNALIACWSECSRSSIARSILFRLSPRVLIS